MAADATAATTTAGEHAQTVDVATPAQPHDDHASVSPSVQSTTAWSAGALSPSSPSGPGYGGAHAPSTAASTPFDTDKFSAPQSPYTRPPYKWWHHILGSWTWELLALMVAIGIQGAIIIILAHFDGQTVPEWPFSINLNTLVALLSVMLRAAMLLVIAQTLGQIKWSWFMERVRPLQHLHDFDQASRSILGSLRLVLVILFKGGGTRAGALAFSAALITISSFAIGPFTQQAIRTGSCVRYVGDTNASLPIAHYIPGTSSYYRIGAGIWEVMVDMKSAMIQGLTQPRGSNDSAIQAMCPTGNCTFPQYGTGHTHESIAMCSMCIDSTSAVTVDQQLYWKVLSLPDPDVNVTAMNDYPWLNVRPSNLSWATHLPGWTPEFEAAAGAAIFNLSILALTTAPCSSATGTIVCPHNTSGNADPMASQQVDYVAASCTLYPCLRAYRAAVSGGVLQETVVQTTPAPINVMEPIRGDDPFIRNYTAVSTPCLLDSNNTWYTAANMTSAPQVPGRTWSIAPLAAAPGRVVNASVPSACLYKVNGIYAMAMASFMRSTLFSDACTYNRLQSGELQCPKAWWLPAAFFNERNATFGSLADTMDTFASAVTRVFRTTGAGPDGQLDDPPGGTVLGLVLTTSVCTYFAWTWMVLPCMLVAACAVLLACTVTRGWRDPRVPVWKGSVLPLLFYGLRSNGDAAAAAAATATATTTTVPTTTTTATEGRNSHAETKSLMCLGTVEDAASSLLVQFRPDREQGFVSVGMLRVGRSKTMDSVAIDSLLDEPRSPLPEEYRRKRP